MQHLSRQELYKSFIDFVQRSVERERRVVHRRMLNVFFWCFLLPAVISVVLLLLMRFQLLPHRFRSFLDWTFLLFPVAYSIYFLSSEVLKDLPEAFKRGGVANVLSQALKDGEWREQICADLRKSVVASPAEWEWIASSFRIDLQRLKYRARYMTALAGAVFFLLMQGIDSLAEPKQQELVWFKDPVLGWVEASQKDFSQFVGLALFLVLLYLSGTQTYHSLRKYLNCAELLLLEEKNKTL